MAMPTKNVAASNTAITPSFCGGLSLRICLSKSSWSRWSILEVPIILFMGNAAKLRCFTDRCGTILGSVAKQILFLD
jgi:hypothetical protein